MLYAKAEYSYEYLRLAALAGSRFNALRTDEQEVKTKKAEQYYTCPASHSSVTHHGARVAPQRCPILRVSFVSIIRKKTVTTKIRTTEQRSC